MFAKIRNIAIKAACLNVIMLFMIFLYEIYFFSRFIKVYFDFKNYILCFIQNLHYNLVMTGYINYPVIISACLAYIIGKSKIINIWARLVALYYFIAYSVVFILLIIDFEYYSYFSEHLSMNKAKFLIDNFSGTVSMIYHMYHISWYLLITLVVLAIIYFMVKYFIKMDSELYEQ